jgi:hypothetical protein
MKKKFNITKFNRWMSTKGIVFVSEGDYGFLSDNGLSENILVRFANVIYDESGNSYRIDHTHPSVYCLINTDVANLDGYTINMNFQINFNKEEDELIDPHDFFDYGMTIEVNYGIAPEVVVDGKTLFKGRLVDSVSFVDGYEKGYIEYFEGMLEKLNPSK